MSSRPSIPLPVATLTSLLAVWLSLTVFAGLLAAGGLVLARRHDPR